MAQLKVDYVCQQKERQWRYVFHKEAVSAQIVLATPQVITVASRLAVFHHGLTNIIQIEASDPLVPGQADVRYDVTGGSAPGTTPDVVASSIRLILRGTGSRKRRLDIRGVPDDLIERTSGGFDVSKAHNLSAIPALEAAILAAGFGIQYIKPAVQAGGAADPDVGWRDIEVLHPADNSGGSRTLVTTSQDHGFAVGNVVKFSAAEECVVQNLTGEWRVVKVNNDNSFEVRRPYLPKEAEFSPENMRVRKAVYLLDPIQTVTFRKNATRQTGTFKSGPRGRRSSKVCR